MACFGGLWSPPLRVQRGGCPVLEGARQRPAGDTASSSSRFGDGAAGGRRGRGASRRAKCGRRPSSAGHEASAAAGAKELLPGGPVTSPSPWGVAGSSGRRRPADVGRRSTPACLPLSFSAAAWSDRQREILELASVVGACQARVAWAWAGRVRAGG